MAQPFGHQRALVAGGGLILHLRRYLGLTEPATLRAGEYMQDSIFCRNEGRMGPGHLAVTAFADRRGQLLD